MIILEPCTSDGHVHRWTLADGHPACLEAALHPAHPDARLALARGVAIAELGEAEASAAGGVEQELPVHVASLAAWRAGEGDGAEALAWVEARAVELAPNVDLPTPAVVPLWKAKAVLQAAGLLDPATAAVVAAGGPMAAVWEYGNELARNSPGLNSIAATLSLSPEQVDDLFRQADLIVL